MKHLKKFNEGIFDIFKKNKTKNNFTEEELQYIKERVGILDFKSITDNYISLDLLLFTPVIGKRTHINFYIRKNNFGFEANGISSNNVKECMDYILNEALYFKISRSLEWRISQNGGYKSDEPFELWIKKMCEDYNVVRDCKMHEFRFRDLCDEIFADKDYTWRTVKLTDEIINELKKLDVVFI